MVGIQNSAEIKLSVKIDKQGLTQLRAAMKTITTAMKTEKAAKDMRLLTNQIEKLKKELRDVKKDFRAYKSEQDKANKATRDTKRDTSAAAQAVRKLRDAQQGARKETQASRQAEAALTSIMRNKSKAVQAYVAQMRQRIGAERTLAVMRRQQLNAERAAAAAMRQNTGRTKEQIAAIQKLRAERRAGAAQTKASIAAEQKLNVLMRTMSTTTRAYVLQMMQRIGAERALSVVQRQVEASEKRREAAAKAAAQTTKRVRIEIKGTVGDLQRYHISLVRAANAQSQFGKSLMQARTFVGRFSKALSEAEGRMDALFRASFRLTIVGFTLQRFAQNIFRWGSSIMDVFEEFEFTLGRAAGALEVWKGETWDGADATQIMQDKVLGLAKSMKVFSAEEVAKGLYFWGSATGQTADSVEDLEVALSGLDKIMKAAFMTNTDYETTIKGVYSILTQFYSGDLSMAGDVTEALFLSTQKTAAEWNDLIQSFKMVGPVAAQAGASFDQVNEAFGKLSDLGLRGSQAGRGLRQFFIQLVRPSGPAAAKWTELFEDNPFDRFGGKTMRDVLFPEGEFIGITEAIQQIDLATQHLNATDRITALARVTTANSLPLLTALMAQERNERLGLAEANDKLRESDPAEYFRENWERLSTTWKAARGSFERVVESLKISLGTDIASALEPLIENLNMIVEKFEEFIKLNPGLVKMAAQFAAVAAAGSMVVGTIFIISGALVGLFAAFHLVFDALGKWAGQVTKAIGVISLFGVAVVENFDYLLRKGTEVVENLTAAFGDMDDAVIDVIGVIEQVTAPVREFMGFIVRLAADIAVVISEVIKFAAAVDGLAGGVGWDIIIYALSVITSAKIIAGLLGLTTGFRTLTFAVAGSALSANLTRIGLALGTITSRSMIANISLLITKMRALMASIPIVGWAALGVSLLFTADQLPIIGDLVRGLTNDWKQLNGQLKESVGFFGEDVGNVLEDLALSLSPSSTSIGEVRSAMTPLVDEVMAMAKEAIPEDEYLELPVLTPENVNENIGIWRAATDQWVGTLGADFANAWGRLTGELDKTNNLVSQTLAGMNEDAIDYVAEWQSTYSSMSDGFILAGRELEIGGSKFRDGLISLSDNVQGTVNSITGRWQTKSSVLDDVAALFFGSAPDKMTFEEFTPWLDTFNKNFAGMLAEAISPSEALALLGSRVGKESSIVNKEVAAYIEKAMSEVDPYKLRELVHTELDILDGETIFDIFGNEKQYGDVQPLLRALMSQYDSAIASLEEGGAGIGMEVIEARLKNALETMQINLIRNAMPDLDSVSLAVQQFALDNTTSSYEQLAQIFLDEFADGKTLAEMITSGKFTGTSISTLKSIADALVNAGYGGDALRELVEAEAAEDGRETKVSLQQSFLDGLSQVNEISFKEFKDALSSGNTQKQLARAQRAVTKMWSRNATSPQARQYRRSSTSEAAQTALTTIQVGQKRGHQRKVRRGIRTGVGVASAAIGSGTQQGLEQGTRILDDIVAAAPKRAIRAIRSSNLPADFKNEYIISYYGRVADAKVTQEAKRRAQEALDSSVEGAYDPLSSISAPKPYDPLSSIGDTSSAKPYDPLSSITAPTVPVLPDIANDPFVQAVTGMLERLPSAGSVITAATTMATGVLGAINSAVISAAASGGEDGEGGGTSVFDTVFAAEIAKGATEGSATMKAATAAADAAMKKTGESLPSDVNQGFIATGMVDAMGLGADLAALSVGPRVEPVAAAAVTAFAQRIKSAASITEVNSAIQVLFASLKGESPPKVGPLKNIDKWGENIGDAWSIGVMKGISKGEEYILNSNSSPTVDITHTGKNVITVKLEVSSPDGTVNRQKQADIRRGALEALTAAGLEHYVTVG